MSRHTFGSKHSSPCEYRAYVYIILSSCRTPTPLINPQCTLIQSLVRTSSLSHHYWILLHVTTSCTVHHVLLVFTIWFCWFLSSAGRLMGTSYGCSREESVLWGRLVVLIRMSWAKMERREARRLLLLLATSMAACVGVWERVCVCVCVCVSERVNKCEWMSACEWVNEWVCVCVCVCVNEWVSELVCVSE